MTGCMADLIVKAAVKEHLEEKNVASDFYDALDGRVRTLPVEVGPDPFGRPVVGAGDERPAHGIDGGVRHRRHLRGRLPLREDPLGHPASGLPGGVEPSGLRRRVAAQLRLRLCGCEVAVGDRLERFAHARTSATNRLEPSDRGRYISAESETPANGREGPRLAG